MNPIFTTLGIAVILFFISLITNAISYVFTEILKPVINVKPFNCYGCLTFWLTVASGTIAAYLITGYFGMAHYQGYIVTGAFVQSAMLGLIHFLVIKSKFKVYE